MRFVNIKLLQSMYVLGTGTEMWLMLFKDERKQNKTQPKNNYAQFENRFSRMYYTSGTFLLKVNPEC